LLRHLRLPTLLFTPIRSQAESSGEPMRRYLMEILHESLYTDYIPGPKDPQTSPVPQDEDEREPMFVQAHDPDYVPESIYPEYIPLEDEHEFPAEREYEDDETDDSMVDYLIDGGDDDDGDSSRDDANDKD
ncbi:hypothetical protein Tco_0288821, partial [Tanacetum coccineum]